MSLPGLPHGKNRLLVSIRKGHFMAQAGPGPKTIILGFSTPMIPDAFDHLPLHMLAGRAIADRARVMKIVRRAGGVRALKPSSYKMYGLPDAGRLTH